MLIWKISILSLAVLISLNTATPYNPEVCVFNKIFTNYNRNIRPVRLSNDTVDIDFKFFFRSLGGINEREETLDTVGYLWMEWYDFQLQWDPDECNGTRIIKLPSLNVWLPEFITSNSVDNFHQYTFRRDFGSWIRYDGHVHWAHGGLFSTVCDLNLREYPFDSHNCSIIVESWLYNRTELTVNVLGAGSDTQSVERDTQWSMGGMDANYYEIAEGWPGAKVTFIWKRKVEYHVFNIICPTIFILLVAMGVFWLPADCGEKVSLSITVLLAFSVIQLVIMDIMPPSSENIPNISLLVVCVMTLSTLSVITSMAVVYISFKPASTPVPRLLRRVLYSRLSWIVGLKAELPFNTYKEMDSSNETVISNKAIATNGQFLKDDMHVYDIISHLTQLEANRKEDVPKSKQTMESVIKRRKIDEAKLNVLKEILGNIKTLVKGKEDQSKDDDIVTEWKVFAKVIDRVIFFVCLIFLVIWLLTFLGD